MRRTIVSLILTALCASAQEFGPRFEQLKRTLTPAQLYAFLYAMPKGADLHVHYSLSFWASDWYESAKDRFYTRVRISNCGPEAVPLLWRNIPRARFQALSDCEKGEYIPLRDAPRDEWISAHILDRPGEGRDEFFERIVARITDLARDHEVGAEVFAKTLKRWAAEGIRYTEVMASPLAATDPDAATAALKKVAAESPIPVRYQGIFIRFIPTAEQRLTDSFAFVDRNRDYWVGVNMAGREDNDKGHPLRFFEAFRAQRRKYSGIHVSLHGGEVDSPGRDVRNTLVLGAERIGHGLNLISDPDTMLLLRHGRTLVESNLVSNKLLEYTPDLATHPFIEYLRFGIPVCLNTDDQGSWDSNLTDEYFTAIRTFQLSWEEVVQLGRNSLNHSFAPDALKRQLLNDFDIAIKRFEQQARNPQWVPPAPIVSGYARRNLLN